MPKLTRFESAGSSVGLVRELFLSQIRADVPYVMEELRDLLQSADVAGQLLDWAELHHLQDAWILAVARQTLLEWRSCPPLAMHLVWADVQSGEFFPEPLSIAWVPTVESETEFLRRVKMDYIPTVRAWAESAGLSRVIEKPKLGRDIAALVQYQVKGDDLEAVHDEYFDAEHDIDTARKAIASVAHLIGVTLRK